MVGHGYGGVWIWLFGLLTLVGLVVLVVVAAGAASSTRRSRAREILDARYANGEIGTEEYRARLQALQDH